MSERKVMSVHHRAFFSLSLFGSFTFEKTSCRQHDHFLFKDQADVWKYRNIFIHYRLRRRRRRRRRPFLFSPARSLSLSSFSVVDIVEVNRGENRSSQFVEQVLLTMRSNKLLFLIFLVVYFIAGLSLLITGSVAHRHATQCKSPKWNRFRTSLKSTWFLVSVITGYSLMSGAGFVIALGVIIIILSIVGKSIEWSGGERCWSIRFVKGFLAPIKIVWVIYNCLLGH